MRAAPGEMATRADAAARFTGGESARKLAPGGDAKLAEDLVQVVLHRARADEQLSVRRLSR